MSTEYSCELAVDEAALSTLLNDIRDNFSAGMSYFMQNSEIVHQPGGGFIVSYFGSLPLPPSPGDFLYGTNARQTPPRDGIILRNDDVGGSWSSNQGMVQEDANRAYRNQSLHYLGQFNPTDGFDGQARQLWRFHFQGQSAYYPWVPYTGSGLSYFQWNGASYDSEYYNLLPGAVINSATLWMHDMDPGYGPTYVGGWGNLTCSIDFHRMLQPWENGTGGPEFGGASWNSRLQWDHALRPELAGSSHPGPTPWVVPGALGGPEVDPVPSFTWLIPNRSDYIWRSIDVTADVQYWVANPDLNFGWLLTPTPGSGIDWTYWPGRPGYGLRPQIEINVDQPDVPSIWTPGASWGDMLP